MDDLISRKDAIETATAHTEQKRGKWIKLYEGNYKCPVCFAWWRVDCDETIADFKFCPNCGEKMEL